MSMFTKLLLNIIVINNVSAAFMSSRPHINVNTLLKKTTLSDSSTMRRFYPIENAQRNALYNKLMTKISASTESGQSDKSEKFWAQQKELAASMKMSEENKEKKMKLEQKEKYARRLQGLVSDTTFYSVMIFSILWLFTTPLTPLSYLFGSTFGLAYSYGLGKYVESIGASVDESSAVQGAGVGQARFAFLILLFIFVGKFREQGLQEIPAIMGFFTYQIASLGQGLREYDD